MKSAHAPDHPQRGDLLDSRGLLRVAKMEIPLNLLTKSSMYNGKVVSYMDYLLLNPEKLPDSARLFSSRIIHSYRPTRALSREH